MQRILLKRFSFCVPFHLIFLLSKENEVLRISCSVSKNFLSIRMRDQRPKASDVFNEDINHELTKRYIIIIVDDEQMHDSLSMTNTGSQNMHSPAWPIKYFMRTQSIIFVFTPFLHRYFSLY